MRLQHRMRRGTTTRAQHRSPSRATGFALVTVILVLAALMLLCTPFLLTASNADQASQQLFSRTEARLALNNASVHARAQLQRSHPSLDTTPFSDGLAELIVSGAIKDEFLDPHDPKGIMWDAFVTDVAGKIDLGSAPPQVLGSMMGLVTRLTKPLPKTEKEITLASVAGLDAKGYLWIGGELIHYGKIDGNTLLEVQRGYGASYDADDNPLPGPLPPSDHGIGATVTDQRATAPIEWRGMSGDVRGFDSNERLQEVNQFAPADAQLRSENFADLMRLGSVFGGVGSGAKWQRAARMTSSGKADVDGHITVDSVRWFNPGSTIQIKSSEYTELAVIRSISNGGTIYLDRALAGNYDAYEAEVRVLSRRPVNINTASSAVLVVLLENLKLRGRNQVISGVEARALAQLILESRPFEGLEDFLRRVVLPAANIEELPTDAPVIPDMLAKGGDAGSGSGGVIDGYDAIALYRNALNSNDFQLEFSTMPFSFTTNDVYDLVLRAVVNAASGVERASAVREETRVVIPQRELQHAWGNQEDFDMMLRLSREAPYWMSGPKPTSRPDGVRTQPPSRMWSHMGTHEGELYLPGVVNTTGMTFTGDLPNPEHIFAEREGEGYAQLLSYQVDENADPEMQGRMIHFTHETRGVEGRYLPDETLVHLPTDPRVQWDVASNGVGLLRGFNYSFWVNPRAHADGVFLDVGGSSPDADRVSVLMENGDLILRALDGGGDHVDTAGFNEASELRYSLTPDGVSPGLPLDTWSHINVDVRGTRPSQMMMLVNGLATGVRTLGLTRLSAQIDENVTSIPVDSTEGFPDFGVVRIGNELIEYTKAGNSLNASYIETGTNAGFGGRNARVQWSGSDPPIPLNIGSTALNHPAGATVELYGFANVLASNVPSGQSALPASIGKFRVATVVAVEGGSPIGEQIDVLGLLSSFSIGNGIKAQGTQVTGLVLSVAETPDDQNADVASVMAAFSTSGGYAALLQVNAGEDINGDNIGGWSVVRYSGWTDRTLQIAAWGGQVPELANLQNLNQGQGTTQTNGGGARAFVVNWSALFNGVPIQQIHGARLFVIPVSLPVPGSPATFLPATLGQEQFAQITELSAGEKTEWVCYDEIVQGVNQQLVRDNSDALEEAWLAATGARPPVAPDDPTTGPIMVAPISPPVAPPTSAATPNAVIGSQWQPILGEEQDTDFVITRAVREAFQFRGVLGTFSHDHIAGTPVLPVFRLHDLGIDGGRCGKNDPIYLMSFDFNSLGWPVTVYRSHKPAPTQLIHLWAPGPDPTNMLAMDAQTTNSVLSVGAQSNHWLVALDSAAPAPVQQGTVPGGSGFTIVDTRVISRATRFPSGERPRNITSVNVGGAVNGGGVPAATVDELQFGATDFATSTPLVDPESTQASQLIMIDDLPDTNGQDIIHVWDAAVRIPVGTFNSTYKFLTDLDQDGGLLRLGNEILAYESVDINTGEITVAENGRGLLGTLEGQHERGSTVTFLDGFQVAILSGGIGAGDASIPVTNTSDFPIEGTLLIGRELIHYTRIRSGAFEMPRSSSEPGRMDEKGAGIFRGRFGTTPEAHAANEPVILFPFRYWDRWADLADGPELSYFGFEIDQPSAFWRSFFWTEQEAAYPGIRMGVLMRSDSSIPWDADPDITDGLTRFYRSEDGTTTKPIMTQSDTVQWRFFIEYQNGAFDADTAAGHAWRTTPLLQNVFVEYLGPSMTLRSVER